MSRAEDPKRERPMAEPETLRSGNEVGGMRAGADHGFGDATQRSMEHDETSPAGRASTGDAAGNPAGPRLDLGGKNAPGAAAGATDAVERPAADERAAPQTGDVRATRSPPADAGDDEDKDEGRHEPIAPVDERNPLKSLGRAVADVATGGAEDTSNPPRR
jgi:hypothetical protein